MVYRVIDLDLRVPLSENFESVLEEKLESAAHKLKAELGSGKRPKLTTIYRENGTVYAIFTIEFRR